MQNIVIAALSSQARRDQIVTLSQLVLLLPTLINLEDRKEKM